MLIHKPALLQNLPDLSDLLVDLGLAVFFTHALLTQILSHIKSLACILSQ